MNNIIKKENAVKFFQTESIVHAQEGYHGKKTCHQNVTHLAEFSLCNNLYQTFTISFGEVQ